MPLKYLLDTNALSDATGSRANRGVMEGMRRHWQSICTSSTVWNELLFGVWRMPHGARRAALEAVLDELASNLDVLPYDREAAVWHAAERVRLARAGIAPPFNDGQIAAVAAVNGLVVVTANVADFRRFSGLTVEDWRT